MTIDNLSTVKPRIKRTKSLSQMEAETLSIAAMRSCSRYDICSAPKCPLDTLIDARSEIPEDPKCEKARATRHRYWESLDPEIRDLLPFQGYFETEYKRMRAARERWAKMSEEQKARISQGIRKKDRGQG